MIVRIALFIAAVMAASVPLPSAVAQTGCLSSGWSAHPHSHATWRVIDGRKCWMIGERHERRRHETFHRGSIVGGIHRHDNNVRAVSPIRAALNPFPSQSITPAGHNTSHEMAEVILGLIDEDFARACLMQYGLKRLEEMKREAGK